MTDIRVPLMYTTSLGFSAFSSAGVTNRTALCSTAFFFAAVMSRRGGTTSRYRRVGGHQVELNWVGVPGAVLTFKRRGRTVVMTGTPATHDLARAMYRLAPLP